MKKLLLLAVLFTFTQPVSADLFDRLMADDETKVEIHGFSGNLTMIALGFVSQATVQTEYLMSAADITDLNTIMAELPSTPTILDIMAFGILIEKILLTAECKCHSYLDTASELETYITALSL